ncbi:MAG: SPOR domain-containing protein [Aquificaceae bacterium]|nr:MAG: SPOR domain-containing protein [Aquificaceae bacterium]
MTRLLIPLLLAANVIYFILAFLLGDATYTPPATIVKGIPAIELLNNKKSKDEPTKNSRCYTLGPFNSEKATKMVARQLNDFGLSINIRRQKTMDTLNYLVYLPAQNTRQDALKIIDDLKKNDVKNYQLIESGPYENAISFGFFDDLNKARRHSEYIRYLGYDSRYTEQKAVQEIFWLDYDEQANVSAPVLQWSHTIDPSSIVQKIPRWCDF